MALDRTYALISPSMLVQLVSSNGVVLRRMAVVDSAARGRQHDAPDLCVTRRLEHAQHAVARRHDQLVFGLRRRGRHRRRHVNDVVAAGDRLGPPLVALEVGGEERETSARLGASFFNIARTPASRFSERTVVRTSCPASRSWRMTWLPTNPEPPVTSTCSIAPLQFHPALIPHREWPALCLRMYTSRGALMSTAVEL